MTIAVDLHAHTLHSHAKDTTAAMVAAAHAAGLAVFGLSEHSLRPAGYVYPSDYQERLRAGFPDYITEVIAEQERYDGRMDVLLGLEMDYIPDEEAYAREAVFVHPYDYVIGGLHFLGHWGFDATAADWDTLSDATCRDHFVRYYADLERMANTGLFQIAAHPDLIKLFCKERFDAWVTTAEAAERIRSTLAAIKANTMALEVSSAGIRKGLGEPYPGPAIMAMARDMGLTISFASDAHATKDVASHFGVLTDYAGQFGYTHSAIFSQRVMRLRLFRHA